MKKFFFTLFSSLALLAGQAKAQILYEKQYSYTLPHNVFPSVTFAIDSPYLNEMSSISIAPVKVGTYQFLDAAVCGNFNYQIKQPGFLFNYISNTESIPLFFSQSNVSLNSYFLGVSNITIGQNSNLYTATFRVYGSINQQIPEPSSIILMGLGIVVLNWRKR